MLAGVVLFVLHVLFTLSGTGFYSFTAALVLLGGGVDFPLRRRHHLLTRTCTPAERGKAQATNDLWIFLVGLAASLSAGVMQNAFGRQTLNGSRAGFMAASRRPSRPAR